MSSGLLPYQIKNITINEARVIPSIFAASKRRGDFLLFIIYYLLFIIYYSNSASILPISSLTKKKKPPLQHSSLLLHLYTPSSYFLPSGHPISHNLELLNFYQLTLLTFIISNVLPNLSFPTSCRNIPAHSNCLYKGQPGPSLSVFTLSLHSYSLLKKSYP